MTAPRRLARLLTAAVTTVAVTAILLAPAPAIAGAAGEGDPPPGAVDVVDLAGRGWVWPAEPFRLERAYVAPAHAYGPGHRGVDLRPSPGTGLRAPAAGVIAFAGPVAGRGILTIDHGDGLVTTLEPIETSLAAGTAVRRGEHVGELGLGGHSAAGTAHFGVRLHGEYVNPLLLLGGVPRAVLLPCC